MLIWDTHLKNWPKNAADAVLVQNQLRDHVIIENQFGAIKIIAGIDCSYDVKNNISRAVVVTMTLNDLKPFDPVIAFKDTSFPYIPGFLSFREAPVILDALKQLPASPDLLMVDGQGIAHPRRFGIAAHLGVLTGLPAIGVAKSRLIGKYTEPGPLKGDHTDLIDKGEKIGTVLRSREKTLPLFISPGHRIDHGTALDFVLRCLTRYRLPEPTRIADKISKTIDQGKNRLL